MQLLQSLEKLGLEQKEQEVYMAVLQLELATANQIAQKTGLKRPTTYDILYRLRGQGFLSEIVKNEKRYFAPLPPAKLIEMVDSQRRALLADLPFLMSVFNQKAKRPKVGYFEGVEGITQLYEDTLTSLSKDDEILAYVTRETIQSMREYALDYIKRRVEKGIKLRGIYHNTPELVEQLKRDRRQLRKSKMVDPEKFPMDNEINIYADKVIIITYSPEPFGVLIESKEIADTQRSIFKMAWNGIR